MHQKPPLHFYRNYLLYLLFTHSSIKESAILPDTSFLRCMFVCTISCNDSALWAIARDLCMGGNTHCSLRCAWLWRNPLFWGGLNQTCKSIWKLSQKRSLKVLCCPSIYSLVASKLPTVQCCDLLSWSELGLL